MPIAETINPLLLPIEDVANKIRILYYARHGKGVKKAEQFFKRKESVGDSFLKVIQAEYIEEEFPNHNHGYSAVSQVEIKTVGCVLD